MRRRESLVGRRFFRLLVVADLGGCRAGRRLLVRCDCGVEKTVTSNNLVARYSKTKSCGCHRREELAARTRTHGDASIPKGIAPEYAAWQGMKNRCYNPHDERWARYGGRGISVCDAWLAGYETFLADMGRRPSRRHSLDRVDNDGNYEPGNCRWATNSEQIRNSTKARIIEHAGESQPLVVWAERTGIKRCTLAARLDRGLSMAEAIARG